MAELLPQHLRAGTRLQPGSAVLLTLDIPAVDEQHTVNVNIGGATPTPTYTPCPHQRGQAHPSQLLGALNAHRRIDSFWKKQ